MRARVSHSIITKIPKGSEVSGINTSGDWFGIEYDKKKGIYRLNPKEFIKIMLNN